MTTSNRSFAILAVECRLQPIPYLWWNNPKYRTSLWWRNPDVFTLEETEVTQELKNELFVEARDFYGEYYRYPPYNYHAKV